MKEALSLKHIEKILVDRNIPCVYREPSDDIPYEHLTMYLGEDYQKRERVLEITAQEQFLEGMIFEKAKRPHHIVRVQFLFSFPFNFETSTTNEVGNLLHFLNHLSDMPGFEMDEVESRLFYRYVLFTEVRSLTDVLVPSIIGFFMLMLDLFTDTIESVAAGKKTFNEVLEQILSGSEKVMKGSQEGRSKKPKARS